jgi:hypothetical protein
MVVVNRLDELQFAFVLVVEGQVYYSCPFFVAEEACCADVVLVGDFFLLPHEFIHMFGR